MSLGSPGVQLKEATKCILKVDKCILYQKVKDNRGDKNLTSTENGRKMLVECSKVLIDGLSGIKDGARVKNHINLLPKVSFFNVTYFNVISDIRWIYNSGKRWR